MEQTTGSRPLPKRIPAPWWIKALLLLAGPGLLLFTIGAVAWIHTKVSEKTTAEIVEVREITSDESGTEYLPVFRWSYADSICTAESMYSSDDPEDFKAGQPIDIRFDPEDPSTAVPDTL